MQWTPIEGTVTEYIELDGEGTFVARPKEWPLPVVNMEGTRPWVECANVNEVIKHVSSAFGVAKIFEGEGVTISFSEAEPNADLGYWHRNMDRDELSFIVEGEAISLTELGRVVMKPGDLVNKPKGIAHRVIAGPQGVKILLIFTKASLRMKEIPQEFGGITGVDRGDLSRSKGNNDGEQS